MRRAAWIVLILVAGCLGPPALSDVGGPQDALIASSVLLAAEAGAEVIRAGGNAADAAAAVQWALNVVEPSMSGLGGGTFILFYHASTKSLVVLDGRETAPAASTPDQFLLATGEPDEWEHAARQGYAVGVPGTLRLFDEVVTRWGALSLAQTFDPAIRFAEEGFPVSDRLHGLIASEKEKLESWPASAAIYLRDSVCVHELVGCTGGRVPDVGETMRNPDLARTFRSIQTAGADAFYEGHVAEAIVATQAVRGGRMTSADLAVYEVKERTPIRVDFQGYDVVSMPPPSSGGIALAQVLEILKGIPRPEDPVNAAHLRIEAMHLAYADRAAYVGDPDFVQVPIAGLLHPDYIAERRGLIDANRTKAVAPGDPWRYEEGSGSTEIRAANDFGRHTTHFFVRDHDGNLAVVTTTLENLFGTGMTVPGYGFLLNNELTDFDFEPGGPNQVEGGKRPRSSMTPTLVFRDGEPVLTAGAPGGPTIIASVTQIVLNVLGAGMDLGGAVDAGRFYSPASPDVLAEERIPSNVREGLAAKGHVLQTTSGIGLVQAGAKTDLGWVAVADSRSSEAGVARVAPPA